MSINTLVFENTPYSLFLYFLYDPDWETKDYLLWGDRFTQERLQFMKENIKVLDYSHNLIPRLTPKIQKEPVGYVKRKLELRNIFNNYSYCIGNVREINDPAIKIERCQIEDGIGTTHNELINGVKHKAYIFDFFKKLALKEPIKISKIKKFILTMDINTSIEYKNKIEVVSLEGLWCIKSNQEKEKILRFFDVKMKDFNKINESCSILFTQPFSETRIDYSEALKIEGYKKIVNKLGIDERLLVIKPHPAEKTMYRDYFPKAIIIASTFPAELMPLLGVKVNKVVTVTSSAAKSFQEQCSEIIYTKADDCFNFPKKLADGLECTVIE